jgi:hypothetical protein
MSRLFTLSLAAGVLFAFSPAARAADEPKDILEKAIKAHGGEELLTKSKAANVKTKGKIDLPGVGEVEFTQDTSYMIPDKFKDTLELKVGGQNVSLFTLVNGDKVTVEVNGKAVDAGVDKVKEQMKGVGHIMEIGRLAPLKNKVTLQRSELLFTGKSGSVAVAA